MSSRACSGDVFDLVFVLLCILLSFHLYHAGSHCIIGYTCCKSQFPQTVLVIIYHYSHLCFTCPLSLFIFFAMRYQKFSVL